MIHFPITRKNSTKMKRNPFLLAIIAIAGFNPLAAQVKIGSNPTTINATTNLDVEATNGTHVRINQADGKTGIGTTTAPTNQLHVKAATDPLRVEGLQAGTSSDTYVTMDATGVFHSVSATKPQVVAVQLATSITTPRGANGTTFHYTNFATVVNTVIGATVAANGDITVPAGTYQVIFSMEGGVSSDVSPPAAGFYINSYYYDFTNTAVGFVRIHQNAPSALAPVANHGVSITYITVLTAPGTFPFFVGWGQAGNTSGTTNVNFSPNGCQLSLTKLL